MPNPLYNDLRTGNGAGNPMFNRIKQFQQMVTGDPRQIVQNMMNSGRLTQAQFNEYSQQANEIYKLMHK